MDIHRAVLEDCSAIARAQVRSWQAAYEDLLPTDFLATLSVDKREAMWREFIARGSTELLVARDGDSIVGFVAFGRCRDEDAVASRAEIWAIYVMPSHWSQGIGSGLWRHARGRLQEQGYESVSLWVLVGNARAVHFYEENGFRVEESSLKEVVIGGSTLQEVRYANQLRD